MKKILPKFLSAIVLVSLFVGCSSGADESPKLPTPIQTNADPGNNDTENNAAVNNAAVNNAVANSDEGNMVPGPPAFGAEADLLGYEASATWVAGVSSDGLPILVESFGDAGPVVLLVDGMSGKTRFDYGFGFRARQVLRSGLAQRLGVRFVLVGALNPTAIFDKTSKNRDGVDVTLDFDALSSPEASALIGVIDAIKPTVVITTGCCAYGIYPNGPATGLAEVLANTHSAGFMPGVVNGPQQTASLGAYLTRETDIPFLAYQFDKDNRLKDFQRVKLLDGLENASEWFVEHEAGNSPPDLEAALEEAMPKDLNPWVGMVIGHSRKGELPIVAESIGRGSQTLLIFADMNGSHPRVQDTVEYLRQRAITNPVYNKRVYILSTPLPDLYFATQKTDPAVLEALDNGDLDIAETNAFVAFMEKIDPDAVLYVNYTSPMTSDKEFLQFIKPERAEQFEVPEGFGPSQILEDTRLSRLPKYLKLNGIEQIELKVPDDSLRQSGSSDAVPLPTRDLDAALETLLKSNLKEFADPQD